MTNYKTETEAESYKAANLARIALEAAIEAVDQYQADRGVVDAPFRVTLHVDNGNEAERELSGPEVTRLSPEDARRFAEALDNPPEPNEALQRAGKAHEKYTGWIRHEGTGMPRDLDEKGRIEWWSDRRQTSLGLRKAALHNWFVTGYYRVISGNEDEPAGGH